MAFAHSVLLFCLLGGTRTSGFSYIKVTHREITGKQFYLLILYSIILIYDKYTKLIINLFFIYSKINVYSGWKATVIGQNNQAGKSLLKTDFKEENEVEKNIKLAVKILLKTMDTTSPTPEKIELSSIKLDANGKISHTLISDQQVNYIFLYKIIKKIIL